MRFFTSAKLIAVAGRSCEDIAAMLILLLLERGTCARLSLRKNWPARAWLFLNKLLNFIVEIH